MDLLHCQATATKAAVVAAAAAAAEFMAKRIDLDTLVGSVVTAFTEAVKVAMAFGKRQAAQNALLAAANLASVILELA